MILNSPITELQKNLKVFKIVVDERNRQSAGGKVFTKEENEAFSVLHEEYLQYEKAIELLKLAGIN